MVSEQEEGREHRVPFLRRLSVYGQDWRRLTEVRLVELVGLGFSRRVVCDCEDGWTSDRTEAQIEVWKRFRRST
jgi:hypothetical protein